LIFADIGECATISHDLELAALLLKPEEAIDSFPIETMPLRLGVLA